MLAIAPQKTQIPTFLENSRRNWEWRAAWALLVVLPGRVVPVGCPGILRGARKIRSKNPICTLPVKIRNVLTTILDHFCVQAKSAVGSVWNGLWHATVEFGTVGCALGGTVWVMTS